MALLGVDTSVIKVLHDFLLENQHEASEFFFDLKMLFAVQMRLKAVRQGKIL